MRKEGRVTIGIIMFVVAIMCAMVMMNQTKVFAEETTPGQATEAPKPTPEYQSEWVKDEGGWKYYDGAGSELKDGQKTVGKGTYYFNENGYLATGFQTVGNAIYYYKTSGATPEAGLGCKDTSKGWKKINNKIYYFNNGGSVACGWKTISKKKFYFSNEGALGTKGAMLTGLKNVSGATYYFKTSGKYGTKGAVQTGWQCINKTYYYFYSNGKAAKNTYIQGYQVTSTGALSKKANALKTKVKKIISKKTKKSQSKSKKLKICYNYVVKSFKYKRSYSFKKTKSWEMDYAYNMLTKKKGNCYNYAATFSFFARELGYTNAKTITGMTGKRGGGWTPHGWVEIKMGKTTYTFDPEMQHAGGYNLYKRTYRNTPLKYKK